MAEEVEVDSYALFAPEAESSSPRAVSMGLVVSTTRWRTTADFYFCQRKRKEQSLELERPLADMEQGA